MWEDEWWCEEEGGGGAGAAEYAVAIGPPEWEKGADASCVVERGVFGYVAERPTDP